MPVTVLFMLINKFIISISGGLNFSSALPQPPDNRTIQNFVKDYVDEYVGGYTVAYHLIVFL